MFDNTDERFENQQAVEDGNAYYCDGCNELSEGRCCASCHVGLCLGCGEPIKPSEEAPSRLHYHQECAGDEGCAS